jgi:gluconolactonase
MDPSIWFRRNSLVEILFFVTLLSLPKSETAFGQAVSPIPDGAVVTLVTPYRVAFGEGPLWHPDGFLLFADVENNRIMKLDPQNPAREVYLDPSGETSGLALDNHLNLIMCRRSKRDVARLESDGSITVLASEYEGVQFNGPNDLTVSSNGTVFFTDPNTDGTPGKIDAVYSLTPDGRIHRLNRTIEFPNGVALSTDEQTLYVSETWSRVVYVYTIENDSTLSNGREFARVPEAQFLDGMEVDVDGLLYVAGGGGFWILSPEGVLVDKMRMSGFTTNLAWGDADYQALYLTKTSGVYSIRLNAKGHVASGIGIDVDSDEIPKSFELGQNYPNPFNPSTVIPFKIASSSQIRMHVSDALGRHVATLFDETLVAGSHSVQFDAGDLPSGTYFYTLEVGGSRQSKSLLIAK